VPVKRRVLQCVQHHQSGNANGNASTGNRNFGRITSIGGSPRDIQLAMKLSF
jgi:hypothetical protein